MGHALTVKGRVMFMHLLGFKKGIFRCNFCPSITIFLRNAYV